MKHDAKIPEGNQQVNSSPSNSSSKCFPTSTGNVWPAASSSSRCWRWSRAPAHLQREPAASLLPAWRAVIMTESARLRRNVAPMAVATPASLPKTSTRVCKTGTASPETVLFSLSWVKRIKRQRVGKYHSQNLEARTHITDALLETTRATHAQLGEHGWGPMW